MSQKKLDAIKKAREFIKSMNLPAGPMDEAVDYLLAEVERLRSIQADLLAACQALVADYQDYAYLPPSDSYDLAIDAIAKATGEDADQVESRHRHYLLLNAAGKPVGIAFTPTNDKTLSCREITPEEAETYEELWK